MHLWHGQLQLYLYILLTFDIPLRYSTHTVGLQYTYQYEISKIYHE